MIYTKIQYDTIRYEKKGGREVEVKGDRCCGFQPLREGHQIAFHPKLNLWKFLMRNHDNTITEHEITEFHSVWNRFKYLPCTTFKDNKEKILSDFCLSEWKSVLNSISSSCTSPRPVWYDTFDVLFCANRKPCQLSLAHSVGLEIPSTIITNSLIELKQGFSPVTPTIFKTLSPLGVPPNLMALIKSIEISTIESGKLEVAPGIFQNEVKREYDLRVTVVGKTKEKAKVFCAQIQVKPDSVDWRPYQIDSNLWSITKLDAHTQEKLLDFHEKSGLHFGTYDFIVCEKPVFLECNPMGNWLWLEYMFPIEYDVSTAIVDRDG